MTDTSDRDALALILHQADCEGGKECFFVELYDQNMAQAVLESEWFKSKVEEAWQAGYSRAVEEERKNQLQYRNRTPQDGW